MNSQIISLESFRKDAKHLAKKYAKLAIDLQKLNDTLSENPKAGIALSGGLYKLRLQNSSTNSGKSGGLRVIYYYLDEQNNVYLMKIYSKTEIENISEEKLIEILEESGVMQA
jgi:mRNA-degrading endonuclease RelE of RelBE toxin-antitoxin system